MADQGKWYKLHVGWDDDPHISTLSLADQCRWCKLGTYIKEHGTNGSIVLVSPAKPLQNKFEVKSFKSVISCIKRLPNYGVHEEILDAKIGVTTVTVTCKNWHQYQADFSRDRMRKLRSLVTHKRRRDVEEKRRDVTATDSSSSSTAQNGNQAGAKEPLAGPYGG